MRDRIEIEKSMIPYSFDILLSAEWFNLEINYNQSLDLFTVSLARDNKILVYNEPIVYGVPLFTDIYQSGVYPALDIVAWDESKQETSVTWDNFNKTVFLTIRQGEEDD